MILGRYMENWNNKKITKFMMENYISRKEGRNHIMVDLNALHKADQSMQYKSMSDMYSSYCRHKNSSMYR